MPLRQGAPIVAGLSHSSAANSTVPSTMSVAEVISTTRECSDSPRRLRCVTTSRITE